MATRTVVITSGTTWSVPADYGTPSTFHCIGAGGTPATSGANNQGGANGGAYAKATDIALTYGTNPSIQIGTGGGTTGSGTAPTANTWFKDGSTVVAAGGESPPAGNGTAANNTAANSTGSSIAAGGTGSTGVNGTRTGAGGGAGGTSGAGGDASTTTGGTGDNATGGAGGTLNNNGSAGSEIGGGAGSGGGGGSRTGAGTGKSGGNYGGAGGGGVNGGNAGGPGAQGVIIITYTITTMVASVSSSVFTWTPSGVTGSYRRIGPAGTSAYAWTANGVTALLKRRADTASAQFAWTPSQVTAGVVQKYFVGFFSTPTRFEAVRIQGHLNDLINQVNQKYVALGLTPSVVNIPLIGPVTPAGYADAFNYVVKKVNNNLQFSQGFVESVLIPLFVDIPAPALQLAYNALVNDLNRYVHTS